MQYYNIQQTPSTKPGQGAEDCITPKARALCLKCNTISYRATNVVGTWLSRQATASTRRCRGAETFSGD
jgi:hypothetical protein